MQANHSHIRAAVWGAPWVEGTPAYAIATLNGSPSAVSQAAKVQNWAHGVLPAPPNPASPQAVCPMAQCVSFTTSLVADSRHGGGEWSTCNTSSPLALHNGAITKSYGFCHTSFLKKYLNIYLAMPGLSCSMWDLVPWPGIEPGSPALGAWSISHWTTREVPYPYFLRLHLPDSATIILTQADPLTWMLATTFRLFSLYPVLFQSILITAQVCFPALSLSNDFPMLFGKKPKINYQYGSFPFSLQSCRPHTVHHGPPGPNSACTLELLWKLPKGPTSQPHS